MAVKYIFVTGGVVSGLGKGIATASIGALLKELGLKVAIQKCDPYLNIDPGTMNPFQHGEVFVTSDGAETDLDLGHYERFLDEETQKLSNQTTGQVYTTVCGKERRGDYQGQTVQIVPHITNEIQRRIIQLGKETDADVVMCEIGGTIGDIESLPFLEAIRQMPAKCGKENVCYIHLTLVPYIDASGEIKTKPTQHSVRELTSIGINPDILLCRTKKNMKEEHIEKIALYCNVDKEDIIQGHDVGNVYEIPYRFFQQNFHNRVMHHLNIKREMTETKWKKFYHEPACVIKHSTYTEEEYRSRHPKIAIVGKYTECDDAYKSIDEALRHASFDVDKVLCIDKIESEILEKATPDQISHELEEYDGILIPGGFGPRGFEGKIIAANWARENKVPFFGICYGMQAAAIAGARYRCQLEDANSTECNSQTKNPVIDLMEDQKSVLFGGTMRLGNYDCEINQFSLAAMIYRKIIRYGTIKSLPKVERIIYETDRFVHIPEILACIDKWPIQERHRHRYEFNNEYKEQLEGKGFIFSGINPESNLVEIIEYPDHPFYIGVQYHPEFKSRPFKPHPIFEEFIRQSSFYAQRRTKNAKT